MIFQGFYMDNNIMQRYRVQMLEGISFYVDCISIGQLGRHIQALHGKDANVKYIERIY